MLVVDDFRFQTVQRRRGGQDPRPYVQCSVAGDGLQKGPKIARERAGIVAQGICYALD